MDNLLDRLEIVTGKSYTDEQKEMIKNFNDSAFCFADPGTGKTETVVLGLIAATECHGFTGKDILACSFSRESRAELDNRYTKLCKRLHIRPTIKVRTLDSLFAYIVTTFYKSLSSPIELESIKSIGAENVEDAVTNILGWISEFNLRIPEGKARDIVYAIRSLNSSLRFDRTSVEDSYAFKKLGIDFEDFEFLRAKAYTFTKLSGLTDYNTTSLQALEILLNDEEVVEYFKNTYKLLVIDEAQDLSEVQLEILSRIFPKIIAIGDIKQQIYEFRGACPEVVQKFMQKYPDTRTFKLTQSFRCDNKIADYAKKLIAANKVGGESFTGVDRHGIIEFSQGSNYTKIVEEISNEFNSNGRRFSKSVMFLYRNRATIPMLIDALWLANVPCQMPLSGGRITNYSKADELEVVKEFMSFISLCIDSRNKDKLEILNILIPELKDYRKDPKSSPLFKIMAKDNCSLEQTNYQFRDPEITNHLYKTVTKIKGLYQRKAKVIELFRAAYPLINYAYLSWKNKYLEKDGEEYIKSISPLLERYDYDKFIEAENSKYVWLQECSVSQIGVRCLTFHASKGTESTVVHILDAEDGIIPNKKEIEKALEKDCPIDAAKNIRNERALVFVAATRAMSQLYIHYNGTLSKMFTGENEFEALDKMYEYSQLDRDEVGAFSKLVKRGFEIC